MKRSLVTALVIGSSIFVGALALVARAQSASLVLDFFGEADQDVTAVTAVPAGMKCGGLTVDAGLVVETTEPPQGFTGACLMNRPYGATVPTVCYSPANATYSSQGGTTQCTAPAANVVQPDWYVNVNQAGALSRQNLPNSYRVMETCAPRLSAPDPNCQWGSTNSNCPCNTQPVSQSCCTHYGVAMTSTDGQTAAGTAYFTAN